MTDVQPQEVEVKKLRRLSWLDVISVFICALGFLAFIFGVVTSSAVLGLSGGGLALVGFGVFGLTHLFLRKWVNILLIAVGVAALVSAVVVAAFSGGEGGREELAATNGDGFSLTVAEIEVGTDWIGNPAVIVKYELKNTGDDELSFIRSFTEFVSQNDVDLEIAILDDPEWTNQVKPGESAVLQSGYVLPSEHEPIDVEVADRFDGSVLISATHTP